MYCDKAMTSNTGQAGSPRNKNEVYTCCILATIILSQKNADANARP